MLLDALLSTVSTLEISQIDHELADLVPPCALREVAGWGLRGEILFAVPCVLESNPALLGYYRLLGSVSLSVENVQMTFSRVQC